MDEPTVPAPEDYVEKPHLLRLLLAHAYLDGAALVAAAKPKDDLDYIEVVGTQLLAQGIELTFKAFLSWSGLPEKDIEKYLHDLASLMEHCRKLMLDTRPVDTIVPRIAEAYTNHWYRYPSPGEVPIVDLTLAVSLGYQLWKQVEMLGTQDGDIEIYQTGKPPLSAKARRQGAKTLPDLTKPRR